MVFDFVVFNKQIYMVLIEIVVQVIDKFNQVFVGIIVLQNVLVQGDFDIKVSFKLIVNLVCCCNVYGNGDVVVICLMQLFNVVVKVVVGMLLIEYEVVQYNWVLQNLVLVVLIIGE